MKKIYLIRHGQSEGNIAGAPRQGPTASLTEKGLRQVETIAERCSRLPIDAFISSTMKRAIQTSDVISKKIGRQYETSDLFVERRRPSVQIGAKPDHPEGFSAEAAIIANFAKPGYRHSDEENFEDLKDRAKRALAYLKSRKEEHILVVTHGLFSRVIVAYAFFGDALTGAECQRFIQKLATENTALTVLWHREESPGSPWLLWTWNDHAHLE
jgi:broad specificity phosphatase PhoE